MIKSMTGYGKAECKLKDKTVSIELKSLNSRQLEIHSKLPGIYREKDLELRNIIASLLKRGKVELSIAVEYSDEKRASLINKDTVKSYYRQLKSINDDLDIKQSEPLLQAIMRLPEVLAPVNEELGSKEWEALVKSFHDSVRELDGFRIQEGDMIAKDFAGRVTVIQDYLRQVSNYEERRIDNIRKRLRESLNELPGKENVDPARFEQELIYYIEKLDITEEKTRLTNHCKYFLKVMKDNGDEPVGKKLGFITQEMGREINTIGSKANDFDIQKLVVNMKDEIEKIKEQLNNIL
jgi:uncharacterized protein (TIGR00255 family)